MKILLFPVIIGGFVLTFIFQAFIFSSSSLNHQNLEKQIIEQNKKIDALQETLNKPQVSQKKAEDNKTQIADNIYTDLLSPENLAYTLGSSTDSSTPSATLKSQWTKADAYETNKASSRIVAQVTTNTVYQISEKKGNWYRLSQNNKDIGWIQNNFLDEKP